MSRCSTQRDSTAANAIPARRANVEGMAKNPDAPTPPEAAVHSGRWARLRHQWNTRLQPGQQATVLAWASFTPTFVGLRALTHWIHAGHGPTGGGISLGGRHFHHYNIGIALLATVAAVGLRGTEKQRRHPAAAIAFGSANALIVDELALLLDLKDVYWAADGRESVDVAVGLIATGATVRRGMPFCATPTTPCVPATDTIRAHSPIAQCRCFAHGTLRGHSRTAYQTIRSRLSIESAKGFRAASTPL